MKKIFTSISMALCLVASSFTTSAQTVQLSEAQKKQIQKEVLPVVFEQIKEQTGLDILGLAKPQLTSDFLGSLPIFNAQSGLRADQPTAFKVQVDSITIATAAIPGIPAFIAPVLGEKLKVEFADFKTTTIPMASMFLGRDLQIELPGTIKAGALAEINITTTGKDGDLAPFTMTMTMSLLGGAATPLLEYSMTQNPTTSLLEASLDIQEGMRTLMGLLSPAEPGQPETPAIDFLVTMDPAGFFTGAIPMSLYGVPEAAPTQRIPMGDAALALDFSNQQMPIKSIGLTSYENAQAKGWRDLMFKMEQKEQDLVLTIDNMVYSSADKNDAKLANSTIVTMTDNTKDMTLKDTKSAVRSVINRVVTELATEGEVAPYRMLVETAIDTNGDGVITADDVKMPVMDVEVTPSIVGTSAAAEMNIKSYAYDETTGAPTITNMTVNATADIVSEIIKVDVIPEGSPAPIASAYFKSNALGVATSNDNIVVSDLKVTPVEGGLYIANNGKATYRIVNMAGVTLVNGTVSGDNAYISTSSLAKGLYVIVVTENGVSQSVKFVR